MTGMSRMRPTMLTRALAGEEAEQQDAEDDEDDQELGAAARMRGRVLADVLDRQRLLVLERVDGHVLGAVVLEDAADLRRPADEQQVADEDGDPDEALERCCDEAPGRGRASPTCGGAPWARNSGSSTNSPIASAEREEQRQRDRAAPPIATPSPAAASEPERISQRVPMTSVS